MTAPTEAALPQVDGDELLAGPRRLLARLDRLLSGRWWLLIVVGLALAISILAAAPSYEGFHPHNKDWSAVEHWIDHPFSQRGLDPTDRAYNFTFRVTVPLVGGLLGLPPVGFLVLQGLAGVGLFAASAAVVERVTGSRRLAALVTIAVGLTWAGACAFIELRANFDAVAIALLVAAMATRRVPLVTLCCFAACWTDERAIPAVAFVVLFHHVTTSRSVRWTSALTNPASLAAVAGVVLHVITRVIATIHYDVHQPSNLGVHYLSDQLSIIPVGMWTGLEGFWVVVAIATVLLWRIRERLQALAYVAVLVISILAAASVVDVTRSMAYLLPAAFTAIAVVARFGDHRTLRLSTYAGFVATAVWPMYYVGGAFTIYWHYPLPLEIFRKLAGVG